MTPTNARWIVIHSSLEILSVEALTGFVPVWHFAYGQHPPKLPGERQR
jgi:hypothetical protein